MSRVRRGERRHVKSWRSSTSSAPAAPNSSAPKSGQSNAAAMNQGEPGWTLRRRLQAIITLALLPVVLVSIFQGVARARLDLANVHDRLMQSDWNYAYSDQN